HRGRRRVHEPRRYLRDRDQYRVQSQCLDTRPPNCGFSGTGVTKAFTSLGNNIANDAASCFTVNPVDLQASPNLVTASISGITHRKPASSASPVVNKGGTFSCEPSDAVGTSRPQGSGCDIGAIELAVGFAGSISATSVVSIGQTVTVTVSDAD